MIVFLKRNAKSKPEKVDLNDPNDNNKESESESATTATDLNIVLQSYPEISFVGDFLVY